MFFGRHRKKTLLSTCHYLVEAASRKRTNVYNVKRFMVQTASLLFKFESQNLCVFHAKMCLHFANSWIKVSDVEIVKRKATQ